MNTCGCNFFLVWEKPCFMAHSAGRDQTGTSEHSFCIAAKYSKYIFSVYFA